MYIKLPLSLNFLQGLPNQHTISGRYRHTSEMPFEWRFASGPAVARFYSMLTVYDVNIELILLYEHYAETELHVLNTNVSQVLRAPRCV